MYCYKCGKETTENDNRIPSCTTHGPLWALRENAPTADAMIIDDDKILLIQRGNEPFKGMWAMPGGFQDFGEHPAETAKREALEETGVTVELDGVVGISVETISPDEIRQVIIFLAKPISGEPTAGDDADYCRWFSLNQLPENILPFHEQRIIDFNDRKPDDTIRKLSYENS